MGSGATSGVTSCIKYVLFFFNLLVLIGGLAVGILGIIGMADAKFYNFANLGVDPSGFKVASIIFIVFGFTIVIFAFFGCCGAIRESKCMLLTYAVFTLIVFALMLAGGILVMFFKGKVREWVTDALNKSLKDKYNSSGDETKAWDELQKNTSCTSPLLQANPYTKGCIFLVDEMESHSKVIGIIALSFAAALKFPTPSTEGCTQYQCQRSVSRIWGLNPIRTLMEEDATVSDLQLVNYELIPFVTASCIDEVLEEVVHRAPPSPIISFSPSKTCEGEGREKLYRNGIYWTTILTEKHYRASSLATFPTIPQHHVLRSGYFHPVLREWQSLPSLITPSNLMLPVFVTDMEELVEDVAGFPGVKQWGVKRITEFLTPLVKNGLSSIILFGVPKKTPKDEVGSGADGKDSPVVQALEVIRGNYPDLLVACDVCICSYTSTGHCCIFKSDGTLDSVASNLRLARQAVAYAKAGAQIVGPSAMQDGTVAYLKAALREAGFGDTCAVLSYSIKFASVFYGPFRHAADCAPKAGDRKSYQIPPGSSSLAMRAAARDVEEGADMLMVKPGLTYLDIVRLTKDRFPNHPLFIYHVRLL
ncbi:unnamed protein product [Darwinula stevensoni]|uniref:Delta-aminolevulinic acid dehydratase n=1 Tax=Darwinula stevensoni TaxID=69355 RepID=A0A7R8X0M1_9CRUS|nr:unnamed protein product [Darwinula stevensoni]CAG0881835.1 unnamed protein product [Darwinula stevensoni]